MCFNETHSKACIGKHLPHSFPIQNGVKQGDGLSPLLFNCVLEYAIRKVKENQVGLKLIGTHQLGDNILTINKNTETLIDISKEVGLEVNREN
jgi:hypothetical protein